MPAGIPRSTLTNTQGTWANVSGSTFVLTDGGDTKRCPSLVAECGSQVFDSFNDVGWLLLAGPNTLAVTWFGTSIDEADMALNTNFAWSTDGAAGAFDVESVVVHENGHVAGLGHSVPWKAVMYAFYGGVDRDLHKDDKNGLALLYQAPKGGGEEGGVPGYCKKHPERDGYP